MGASNCCKPNKKHEENTETEFDYVNHPPSDHENDNDNEDALELNQIQAKMINEPNPITPMQNTNHITQLEENGQIDKDQPIQVKSQQPPRIAYWNDFPGNIIDLQYDISEEKSPEIFDYLNEIKMNPSDYLEEAKDYGLEHMIQSAIKNLSTQTPFVNNEGYYYMIRELLATPSDPKDLSLGIKNYFEEKHLEVDVVLSQSSINNIKEAVWNMLAGNKDSQKQILTLKSEYCVVCALPIPDTNDMNNYFVLLKNAITF